MMRLVWPVALVAVLAGPLAAQQRPPSCDADQYRQFDFWIGTWEVFNLDGRQVGVNTITLELNGCALHERWQSFRGPHRGNSYSMYDRATGRWHQIWVDNGGLLLLLDGGLRDGAMVLEDRTRLPGGGERLDRITWTPEEREVVRQLWEQSADGGTSWSMVFDGRYVRH